MGIGISAMGDKFNQAIVAANIPTEVMHRVVAMASGGKVYFTPTEQLLPYLPLTVFVIIALYSWLGIV